ncbi:MAG: hypothetical protein WCS27_10200 [Victivallaceae bacterium]
MRRKKEEKSPEKKQRRNKVLKIILVCLAFFTLLFWIILIYFVHLVFDPAQEYDTESLTTEDIYHQSNVIKRLTAILWRSRPGRVCVLTLSQAEVNALIAAISNSDSLSDFLFCAGRVGDPPKKRPYKIVFKGNCFDIKFSLPTDIMTPFGKNINLTVSGKPGLDEKGIGVDLNSVSAGDVALPPGQVEKILHILLEKYEKDETFKRIHDIVVKAYITPEKNLVIYFYPYRIRNVLTEGLQGI